MKNTKQKFAIFLILLAVLLLAMLPSMAFADTGPKPSVQITFKNLGDEECWCTLLSETSATGPYFVWNGKTENIIGSFYDATAEELEIFYAFVEYEDADGYYFLQIASKVNVTKQFKWGYYPPSNFKILLYFPETETFVSSEITEKYAFDSYFSVDMSVVNTDGKLDSEKAASTTLTATHSYNYLSEILGLLARCAITIAVEMLIAFIFRIKGKRAWLTILFTNIGTQLALNIILNVTNYFKGSLIMFVIYFLAEFFVWIAESVVYSFVLRKAEPKVPVWKSILYAFVANLLSFTCGMLLAFYLPVLF